MCERFGVCFLLYFGKASPMSRSASVPPSFPITLLLKSHRSLQQKLWCTVSLISAAHDIPAGISEQHLEVRFSAFIHNQWPPAYYFCCSDSFAGSRDTSPCVLFWISSTLISIFLNLYLVASFCPILTLLLTLLMAQHFPLTLMEAMHILGCLKRQISFKPTQVSPFLAHSCLLTVVLHQISWTLLKKEMEMENIS